jgi:hypothetical protein
MTVSSARRRRSNILDVPFFTFSLKFTMRIPLDYHRSEPTKDKTNVTSKIVWGRYGIIALVLAAIAKICGMTFFHWLFYRQHTP